ncbi:GNAT family N-acetyltransferase [Acidisoma cellulosilytica]|uniref:GNAT family N-acetyltransferase n=1 Tax=Acidisoma cellulosilyticum TaxID=2802395 RepID=A0A963Z7X3_9PROT|nr:N-acetyltransferase [Acidisoma cellulosilyticum]MCB8883497.1 GNAT family N-acetyltransferase [Acidisoma cellulosilyticum]
MAAGLIIRPAIASDDDAVWAIIGPIIAAGETYALPRDWSREQALAYWLMPDHAVFVAETDGEVLGTFYLQANKQGGGDHVANAGFATAARATGRGIARSMGRFALTHAKVLGFRAMQFNFVVSSNAAAVHLWTSLGFETLCRQPEAFAHPTLGYVDALLMFQRL